MKKRSFRIVPILLALAVVAWQYFGSEKFTNPETGQVARVALSESQEQRLGLQTYQQVLSESKVIPSGPQAELVRRVAGRLAAVTGDAARKFQWSVSLVDNPQINAFCLPGGKIVIYTGILKVTQTEAGLAAVMGHEMAHATARHGSQRMLQSKLMQTAAVGANFSLAEMEPQQRAATMAVLTGAAQYGAILPFSRGHELEADHIGLLYMARAGYDPREAVEFWKRMGQVGGQKPPEFASTHPSDGSRVAQLQKLLPEALTEYEKATGKRLRELN